MKKPSNGKKRVQLLLDREILRLLSPKQLTAAGGLITVLSDDTVCTSGMSENHC
jgi:hypothetical protein